MPRPPKLRRDLNETAFDIVQAATGQGPKPKPPGEGEPNPVAAERGSLGGKKGGKVRAKRLSAKRRKQIGRQGAAARWKR